MNRVGMRPSQRQSAFNLTPLRLQMLRDAERHGSALAFISGRRATGMMRAFQAMVNAGLLADDGSITAAGVCILRRAESTIDIG
jgi:hypothetical protein